MHSKQGSCLQGGGGQGFKGTELRTLFSHWGNIFFKYTIKTWKSSGTVFFFWQKMHWLFARVNKNLCPHVGESSLEEDLEEWKFAWGKSCAGSSAAEADLLLWFLKSSLHTVPGLPLTLIIQKELYLHFGNKMKAINKSLMGFQPV